MVHHLIERGKVRHNVKHTWKFETMSGNVVFQPSGNPSKATHKRCNDAYWKCKDGDFEFELLADHECRVSRVGDGKF